MFYFFAPLNSNWNPNRILCMCHYLVKFQERYPIQYGNSLVSHCIGEEQTLPEIKIEGLMGKVEHWKQKCNQDQHLVDKTLKSTNQEKWLLYQPLVNKYACHTKCTNQPNFCRQTKKKINRKKKMKSHKKF